MVFWTHGLTNLLASPLQNTLCVSVTNLCVNVNDLCLHGIYTLYIWLVNIYNHDNGWNLFLKIHDLNKYFRLFFPKKKTFA